MSRQQAGRALAGALLAMVLACPGLARAADEPVIALRLPASELSWRGVPAAEAAGNAGAILYPAAGLVGLLAAVFTHGAIVEGTRSAERSKQQQVADQVLEPYRAALSTWTPRALFEAAAAQMPGTPPTRLLDSGTEAAAGEWLVEMAPGFALTPDHGTLMLDNSIRITRTGAGEPPRFEGTVRVLSAPLAVPAQAHWSADEAKALKDETAAMLAHTVQLAFALVRNPVAPEGAASAPPFRTHRYLMGAEERSERSQLVARACNRGVLRTLRGNLLSVALRPDPAQPPCTRPYQLTD